MASQAHDESEERVASVRLPVSMHDRLREVAASEYRTVSQELRMLVERHLDEGERKAA